MEVGVGETRSVAQLLWAELCSDPRGAERREALGAWTAVRHRRTDFRGLSCLWGCRCGVGDLPAGAASRAEAPGIFGEAERPTVIAWDFPEDRDHCFGTAGRRIGGATPNGRDVAGGGSAAPVGHHHAQVAASITKHNRRGRPQNPIHTKCGGEATKGEWLALSDEAGRR